MSSIIAIIGRPNVGKSRLFNRLIKESTAIVHDEEGVTRDRQYSDGEWNNRHYTMVDTGGFVPSSDDPILKQMRQQVQLALDEADAIIFVVDGRAGRTGADEEVFAMVRKTDKPVFCAVNKADTWTDQSKFLIDFYQFGRELYPISAEHGSGVEELMDAVTKELPPEQEITEEPFARVAVVGKPNVGKSSLVNAFLGEKRLLTNDVAGTTRDAIDTRITEGDREFLVIDTAGLRRKNNISERLEEYAVMQAIRSIDRADVALLVLDATDEISKQDKRIASVVQNRGRGCVLVVNKWDLIENKTAETAGEFATYLRHELQFVPGAPIIFVSALTGQRVRKIFDAVEDVFEQYTRRIPTAEVNRFLESALQAHSPPIHRNKRPKFFYATQVGTRPPSFMFSANAPGAVAPSYRKFLVNQLREAYGFEGVPIKTVIRKR